jgi:hypothetical protein
MRRSLASLVAAAAFVAAAAPGPVRAEAPPAADPAGAGSTVTAPTGAPDPVAAGSPVTALAAAADPSAAGTTAAPIPGAAALLVAGALDPSALASLSTAGDVTTAAAAPALLPAPPSPPPPAPPAPLPAAATAKARPWRTLPLIGLHLGVGFPDLVNANLLVRPVNWVRLYAGPSWGYVSWGMQGGIVLSPINWYVTPTLSFQAGKLFGINASRFVKDETKDGETTRFKPLLQRIDYHYYAGDLGLELGSPRGFNFFLRFGLSFVVVKANGTGTVSKTDGSLVMLTNPKVSAWLPSAKLGFQYWF